MSISTESLPGTVYDPLYPESDGEPLGETPFHIMAILHLYDALKRHFRRSEDVYVAADMFLYYEQGVPAACKVPDVMVCFGVAGNHERNWFRTWEEKTVPTVIFEITSSNTRREDDQVKPAVYAQLGVREYFLFDPQDKLRPRLKGFRLERGTYAPLAMEAGGTLTSHELGMQLVADAHLLRLVDVRTGQRLLTSEEQDEVIEAAHERFDVAKRQAEHATRLVQREIEQARSQAEAERQRAEALAAEVASLRAKLNPPPA